jgi:hypothetical protein
VTELVQPSRNIWCLRLLSPLSPFNSLRSFYLCSSLCILRTHIGIEDPSPSQFFFLENHTRIYGERILLLLSELESDSKSAFNKLLSEIIGSGSCFNFFDFLFLFFLVFFLESLRVFEKYRREQFYYQRYQNKI